MTGTITIMSLIFMMGADGAAPGGALLGWTSQDPVCVRSRAMVQAGQLAAAETLLKDGTGGADAAATQAREEMVEIIRRIRLEYTLTPDALLARVKRSIPEATLEDLARWREAGQVRFRTIDGRLLYFKREPGHLFRFCPEARRRMEAQSPGSSPASADAKFKTKLLEHLEQVIAAAEKTGKAEVVPVKHRVSYRLTVSANRPGARAGSTVRCWLPFPQEYRQQKDVKLIRTSPAERVVAPTAVDGSPMRGAPQRTVYLERRIDDPAKPIVFELEFEYTSCAYYPRIREADVQPLPAGFERVYLSERSPHIVFTPEVRAAVEKIVGVEQNPLTRVRKIYRYLDGKVRWCPEEEYAIIPNFSMKALTTGHGDCGVQSTLFITLCRAAGVPARWQSGFETKPWGWNMHDWSEVYIAPWGWLPVDVSYGLQPSEKPEINEFYIGHQDSYRLIVNLDYGSPLTPAKRSPRSEPADFQRGEVELDGRNLYFDEWDYEIKFDWEPLGG